MKKSNVLRLAFIFGILFSPSLEAVDCCPDGSLPDSQGRCECTPDWQCSVTIKPSMEITSVEGPQIAPINTAVTVFFNVQYHTGSAPYHDANDCEDPGDPPPPETVTARGQSRIPMTRDIGSVGPNIIQGNNYYNWTDPCSGGAPQQEHENMQHVVIGTWSATGTPPPDPPPGGGSPPSYPPPDENGNCEDPYAPDEGEAYQNGQSESIVPVNLFAGEGEPKDEDFTDFLIEHKIITVNSPQERNMIGTLKVEVVEGDASDFIIRSKDGVMTFPANIAIDDGGHSGCGRHDWHSGSDRFEAVALDSESSEPALVKLKFTTDPDEGSPNGKVALVTLMAVTTKATSHGFPPTGLSGKYDETPEKGSIDNLISVWPSEEITVIVNLPEPFKSNPDPGLITWEAPEHTVPDQTTEYKFKWTDTDTKTVKITVGSSTFKVVIDLPNVGNISQTDALLAVDPISAGGIVTYGNQALIYANAQYPTATPKKDAIRHSYWTALCVSDVLVDPQAVLFVTTAHEHNNKWGVDKYGGSVEPQQAFNSTMDLRNNLIGLSTIHSTGAGTPNETVILQDLNAQYEQGLMWIYDGDASEDVSEGILSKSNHQKIYSP